MIRTLLVANRAEVASRVFRTARAVGIRTVAVTTPADRHLPYVGHSDEAIELSGNSPAESYLNIDAILEAAQRSGADAIHPGWGFLAESPQFARAVRAAGLTWVGPTPETMEALGNKARARQVAIDAGVPVVDGSPADIIEPDALECEASRLGTPLLIKARAGGGGRGIRRVDDHQTFRADLASAQREALAAFGDGTVLLERCIDRPRHVEVQFMGDGRGNAIHLFTRDCSIQRKHQKLVEEAPAPGLPPDVEDALHEYATTLAKGLSYAGAGTAEFLVEPDGTLSFLEVNTRLQVEHEITECITGIDLVEWQLAVAEGRLDLPDQGTIGRSGHAIQVRVIAEDPNRDWAPSHGRLHCVDLHGDRVRPAYATGNDVSIHYDSLLAKIITVGSTRGEARRGLVRALQRSRVIGLTTNLPLLQTVMGHPNFSADRLHTAWLAEQGLPTPVENPHELARIGAAIAVVSQARSAFGSAVGFRFGSTAPVERRIRIGSDEELLSVTANGSSLRLQDRSTFEFTHIEADRYEVHRRGRGSSIWRLHLHEDVVTVHDGIQQAQATLLPRFPPPPAQAPPPGSCIAPTPGTLMDVRVSVGQDVSAGQVLLVLEAMKMEHSVTAPHPGTVLNILHNVGETVDQGDLLVRLSTPESAH